MKVVPWPAVDSNFQLASMSLHYSVDHGKPEAGAELTFCREERFEAPLADTFAHAGPRIAHLNDRIAPFDRGLERNATAFRHRVDGIENQIGQHLAESGLFACDKGGCFHFHHHFEGQVPWPAFGSATWVL